MQDVVIVGGSLAGVRAAESLRAEGFTGTITMVSAESHAPYDRPPLSKKLLAEEWDPARIALRRPDALAELRLDLRLGLPAIGLDTGLEDGGGPRQARLADGSHVGFDGLIIATGASPRRLPGQPEWVHELRTLDDALGVRSELRPGRRMVVIGAGFIGMEVAATARAKGLEVTVLEGAPAPLMRGLGPVMGEVIGEVHRRHGVDVRCGVQVAGIEPGAVILGDGTRVSADVVVSGIGVTPAIGWLTGAAGLRLGDGVICDATLWTGVPGIYAAGDCVRWPNERFGEEMRIEHWTNAAEQGALAAKNLLAAAAGRPGEAYRAVPFFWSDQFEARIQFLGRRHDDDEVQVVAGSLDTARFVALFGRHGRLRGALGVSMPRVLMGFRRLIDDGASWDDALTHAASLPG